MQKLTPQIKRNILYATSNTYPHDVMCNNKKSSSFTNLGLERQNRTKLILLEKTQTRTQKNKGKKIYSVQIVYLYRLLSRNNSNQNQIRAKTYSFTYKEQGTQNPRTHSKGYL